MWMVAEDACIANEIGSFDRRRQFFWMQGQCLVFSDLFVLYQVRIQEMSDVSVNSGRRRSAKSISDFSVCVSFVFEVFENLERSSLPRNAILLVRA